MRSPRRPRLAVDSHDAGALRAPALRTRVVRLALAAGAALLLAAAAASARDLDVRERGVLPSGSSGVVVLDLSLSIAEEDYGALRRALRLLIEADAPVGLVVFSDVAYELLPPRTPARELRPFLRLLDPNRPGDPASPWAQTFRLGTRISSSLALAGEMLERDGVEDGSILLVSDLETAPEDVPDLVRTLQELAARSIVVQVLPLSPSSDARRIFGGLIGSEGFASPPRSGEAGLAPPAGRSGAVLPLGLLVLGGLFFGALAAHERFAGRLGLPRAAGSGA